MITILYVLQRTDRSYPSFATSIETIDKQPIYSQEVNEAIMYSSWEDAIEMLADRKAYTEEQSKILIPRAIKIELL